MYVKRKSTIIIALLTVVLIIIFILFRYLSISYLVVPSITLLGEKTIYVTVNNEFKDPGVKASIKDVDASKKVKITGNVNTKKLGTYTLKYSITNTKGKREKSVERKVIVKDDIPPIIELTGGEEYNLEYGNEYVEPGFKAMDNLDGDITKNVKITGSIDNKQLGTYELTYTVSDSSKNKFSIKRKVLVVDTNGPSIYLNGNNPLYLNLNQDYVEPGYRAVDDYDGDITSNVVVKNYVVPSVAGTYAVNYAVYDSSGNYGTVNRTVYVGTNDQISANTYVAVSIDEQYVWFYKNGTILTSAPIVTGTKGVNDTPRGTYQILSKARNIYLTGPDYKSFVNFWMRFTPTQIGLHDASWRSTFGGDIYVGNGSHGCVNMPYNTAKIIYENAPIGTKVVVY